MTIHGYSFTEEECKTVLLGMSKQFKLQSCEHFAIVPEKVTVLVSYKQIYDQTVPLHTAETPAAPNF